MYSGGIAPPFLRSALDRGELLASRPARFTPREKAPGNRGMGGRVGPKDGLDAVEKRKITLPYKESNPYRLAHSSSLC